MVHSPQVECYSTLFKQIVVRRTCNLPNTTIVQGFEIDTFQTLGNHEFDDGIAGLVPFLNHIKAPVVVSNIDDSKELRLQNLYRKSVVVEKGGKKIGIIGVLLTETNVRLCRVLPEFSIQF
jgi:hypothetical protein